METRERILETARVMFNEQGLPGVSVREIARALEMSPGNLSYHFKTKGDLVAALLQQLHDSNTADAVEVPDPPTLRWIHGVLVDNYRRDWEYRGVMASYADAVLAHDASLASERSIYPERLESIGAVFTLLVQAGLFHAAILEVLDELSWFGAFMGRHVLSDAALHAPERSKDEVAQTYALRHLAVFSGYYTEKAREEFFALREEVGTLHDKLKCVRA